MEENKDVVVEETPNAELETINQLIADKEALEAKLKEETKKKEQYLNEVVNRRPFQVTEEKQKEHRPAIEIAKELSNIRSGDVTNREFIAKSVEYRDAFMHETGRDPWTDMTTQGPGEETPQTKKVADTFKKLLKENSSPEDFRLRLNSIMKDDPKLISKLAAARRKKG